MAEQSRIEWTEATWNPVTGCTKVSPGCKHCYAEVMAARLQRMGVDRYKDGFKLTLQADVLQRPFSWRKPRLVFVNSMSDLFHDGVPDEFIQQVFAVMAQAERHTFQVLTKRADRLAMLAPKLAWPRNVWMGVSVESADYLWRVERLRSIPAAVRFLSVEPMLGPIDQVDLAGIHWVIVGGESGRRARPMEEPWVVRLKDQCDEQRVHFFFKQWGGVNKKKAGRTLLGRTWDDMPARHEAQAAK